MAKSKYDRPFETWESEEIELTYGLTYKSQTPILTDWLNTPADRSQFSETDKFILTILKEKTLELVDFWNEDELKFKLIAPILNIVDFDQEGYHSFTQRTIEFNHNNISIGGKVDFMVATGKQHPRSPFFFLHEYKQERKRDNDPFGQVLIAMLTAQTLNNTDKPLYGAYVTGRNWFFVVLNGKEYARSGAFDASSDDIFNILAILRKVKDYIRLQLNSEKTADNKPV